METPTITLPSHDATPAPTTAAPTPPTPSTKGGKSLVLSSFQELKSQRAAAAKEAPTASTEPKPAETPKAPKADETITKPDVAAAKPVPPPLKKGLESLIDDEPVKPAAPEDPAGDDAPADAKTPEAKNAWSALKTETKTLRNEKTAWEAEKTKLAAELKAAKEISDADPVKKRNSELEARNKELEAAIAVKDVTKSKTYQKDFQAPYDDMRTRAQTLAKKNEIPWDKMDAALHEVDPKRQEELLLEVMEPMNEVDKGKFTVLAGNFENILSVHDRIVANARDAGVEASKLEIEESAKAKTERRAAEMREIAEMKPAFLKAAAYLTVDGEDADSVAQSIIDEANAAPLDELDIKTASFNAAAGVALPKMHRAFKTYKTTAEAEIKALKAEIESYSSATPRTSTGSTAKVAATNPAVNLDGTRKSAVQLSRELIAAARQQR